MEDINEFQVEITKFSNVFGRYFEINFSHFKAVSFCRIDKN